MVHRVCLLASLLLAAACGDEGSSNAGSSSAGSSNSAGSAGDRSSGGTASSAGSGDAGNGPDATGGDRGAVSGSRLAVFAYGGCALDNRGIARCWGGDPTTTQQQYSFEQKPLVSLVSADEQPWGWDADGERVDPIGRSLREPFVFPSTDVAWRPIPGNYNSNCSQHPAGWIRCRDVNISSVLASEPQASAAAGDDMACGLSGSGKLVCIDIYGRVPDFPTGQGSYTQVACTHHHCCAVAANNTLACWGPDDSVMSQEPEFSKFVGLGSPPSGAFVRVSLGGNGCAIRTDGTLACWAKGAQGPYSGGCAAAGCDPTVPPAGTYIDIAVGDAHACAMRPNGSVVCWGSNTFNRSTPPPELQ